MHTQLYYCLVRFTCYLVIVFEKKDGLTAEELEQREVSKRKMLGNIKFIGMCTISSYSFSNSATYYLVLAHTHIYMYASACMTVCMFILLQHKYKT